ncbi:hypothetical protein L1887_42858 [Cichorium endivia]|nr:hypothetical protein L1887_42858 [Cichorium endivia]
MPLGFFPRARKIGFYHRQVEVTDVDVAPRLRHRHSGSGCPNATGSDALLTSCVTFTLRPDSVTLPCGRPSLVVSQATSAFPAKDAAGLSRVRHKWASASPDRSG